MPILAGVEPLQVARAWAALAGAGAWDAAPTAMNAQMADAIALHISYTRGGAGGAFDFQIQYSPFSIAADVPAGMAEWYTMAIYDSGAVAAGGDTQSRIQREYVTYQATAAAQEAFVYDLELLEGTQRIRVRARESGAVANPGSLGIIALMSNRTRVIR